jgi:hypothetical protein
VKFDLFKPVLNILKCFSFVDGVGENDAHGSSVVCLGDCFELLLASCVPDLETYFMVSDSDGFYLEIYSDGGEMRCHESVIAKLEQHIGFANSTVPDNKQFYMVVVVLIAMHVLIIKSDSYIICHYTSFCLSSRFFPSSPTTLFGRIVSREQ